MDRLLDPSLVVPLTSQRIADIRRRLLGNEPFGLVVTLPGGGATRYGWESVTEMALDERERFRAALLAVLEASCPDIVAHFEGRCDDGCALQQATVAAWDAIKACGGAR